jgi:hypothetical protein
MEEPMQAAIDRVMQTFTMMARLTPEEMQVAREPDGAFGRDGC